MQKFISIIFILVLISACQPAEVKLPEKVEFQNVDLQNKVLDSVRTTIPVDTSIIAVLEYDKSQHYAFIKGEKTTLNMIELQEIEDIIRKEVKNINILQKEKYAKLCRKYTNYWFRLENFIISLENHNRQYIPVINDKNEKEIWINLFCTNYNEYPYWKETVILVIDGGNCYFNLKINLTKKTYSDFKMNSLE